MSSLQEPYVGPRTFEKDDADIFRGRDREARDLAALVSSQRNVLFYAQSGAGKSSLINAKLVPGLEKKGFEVLPVGRVGGESNPVDQVDNIFIYTLLLTQDKGKEIRPEEENRLLQHRWATMQLVDFLNHLVLDDGKFLFNDTYQYAPNYRPMPRVLIIDQFEEILTNHLNYQNIREQRIDFFEQINSAMDRDPWLWVVFSLRADYVAGLDPYAHLLPESLRNRYYMERMDASGALKAIMEPVEIFDWAYEPKAAEELCRNLRFIHGARQSTSDGEQILGDYVEPVQLQVVCYQLWRNLDKNRNNKIITLPDLDNQARIAGGESVIEFVDSALSQFYNQAVQAVAEAKPGRTEADIRNWFGQELITPGNSRNLIIDDMAKVGSLDKDLVKKLDKTYRLVRPEVRGYSIWYELTHDRFIHPIQDANQKWLENKPAIYHAARAWDQGGRKDYFLFTGERLNLTLKTLESAKSDASDPLIQDFVKACQRADSRREDDNRVRMNYDRALSYGAALAGAALLGYIPIISILIQAKNDSGILSQDLINVGVLLAVVFAIWGAAIGWIVKRYGYDLYRTREVQNKQVQIFQDNLEKIDFSVVSGR